LDAELLDSGPSPWVGHIPFAFWIVEQLQPRILVELGTHYGLSYFSFCQSVRAHGLSTKCYAVDTWQGDEHAGFYGEEVFAYVQARNQRQYHAFSRLLRMRFDDALSYFSDGTVDLLHIDGLHTYEAVRHDFETWLPKLSSRGVVLFHDINVRERGFGVWRLWEELSTRYPHIEFEHSHGLGVLFVGDAQPSGITELLNEWSTPGGRSLVKYFFAKLGHLVGLEYQAQGHNQAIAERDGQISNLNQAVAEQAAQISSLNQIIAERDGQISSLNQTVAEQEQTVGQLQSQLAQLKAEQERLMQQLTQAQEKLTERDGQIAILGQTVAERDGLITAILGSRSWRLTRPMRWLGDRIKRVRYLLRITRNIIAQKGGIWRTCAAVPRVYRREGFAGIKSRIRQFQTGSPLNSSVTLADPSSAYSEWINRYDTLTDETRAKMRQIAEDFTRKPLISVVMPCYNPKPEWLKEAIESVRRQIYPYWELCIADDASTDPAIRPILEDYSRRDARIRVVFREANGHISAASNSALALATGEFVAFLDHDGELAPHALFRLAVEINAYPTVDIVYSDEDKISEDGKRSAPFFKPDWSPHLAVSQAYLGHLVCYRTDVVRRVGGLRTGFEGAQDYDLWLRAANLAREIRHVPQVLYHWRTHPASTAADGLAKPYAHEAGRKAVAEYLKTRYPEAGIEAVDGNHLFTYRAKFWLPPELIVSIVIPTKDRVQLLEACVHSIQVKSSWQRFEILIIDNNSEEPETFAFFDRIQEEDVRIRVLTMPIPFNWSRINNLAAKEAKGDVLVFLNNDTAVITEDWLENLAGYARLPDVGTVGALLQFEDGTIQHSGVVVGMNGWAEHVFRAMPPIHAGSPFVSPVLTRNVLAVTGACMAVTREKFDALGCFDEEFMLCGSDVELGLRAHRRGLFNVLCAEAWLYHYESKTRSPYVPESDFVQSEEKYAPYRCSLTDPFFNPNLSLDNTTPTLRQ
jgi:GT2 family glycosyltransferase/uncharacterized coiled-coil protein SlyX